MKDQADKQRVVLTIPPGLEVAAVKTVRREYGARFDPLATGLIQSKDGATDPVVKTLLENAPIWTLGSFRLVEKVTTLDSKSMDDATAALAETVNALGWHDKAYWLDAGAQPAQMWARQFLQQDFGLRNDPGNYELTLKVISDAEATFILLGPSISIRQRFSYRKMDVAASINPVLAALLVRLLPQNLTGRVIDPTCGSGTLLFERLRYSNEVGGLGIDISGEAQKAFNCNLRSVDLGGRAVDFWLGSSINPAAWEPCSSVVCNLPFGIRTKIKSSDLDRLYREILENAHANLVAEGRILMTSSYKRGLEEAAAAMANKLKVLSKYRTEMGGLFYQVFVFGHV